jgi:hypothetical protein
MVAFQPVRWKFLLRNDRSYVPATAAVPATTSPPGRALPGFMMGTSRDPGKIMGTLFANAPGPQVSSWDATVARLYGSMVRLNCWVAC